MSNVNIVYSKDDFYYYNPNTEDVPMDCSIFDIDNKDIDTSCLSDPNYDPDNSNKNYCYQRELCKNKNNADNILKITQSHTASDGRYSDFESKVSDELQNTINLGIGIVLCGYFIYRGLN